MLVAVAGGVGGRKHRGIAERSGRCLLSSEGAGRRGEADTEEAWGLTVNIARH